MTDPMSTGLKITYVAAAILLACVEFTKQTLTVSRSNHDLKILRRLIKINFGELSFNLMLSLFKTHMHMLYIDTDDL